MCLAQGHNAVTPVRLEPATPRSQVKYSTTEPLRSQDGILLSWTGNCTWNYMALLLVHYQVQQSSVVDVFRNWYHRGR